MKANKLFVLLAVAFFPLNYLYASNSTDYFQSVVITGNWSSISTWQSSSDGFTWVNSTLFPTSNSSGIYIRNGNTVIIDADASAKLLTIDIGGVLTYQNLSTILTIVDDGTSANDFVINGRYELNGAVSNPSFVNSVKVIVNNGGEVRVISNANGGSDNFARDTHVYFYTGSLFNWNINSPFQTANVIYFPNATLADKTIFRISTSISGIIGSNMLTIFNCKFEIVSGCSITFINSGTKIFRDGFGGAGTIIHSNTSGPFKITSPTAVIDGSVTIDFENSNGNAIEIVSGAIVTISGSPVINVGTATYSGAIMFVGGKLIHNGLISINIANGILFVNGNDVLNQAIITGFGTFTGSLIASVIIDKFVTATLYFMIGGTNNYLKDLTVNDQGILTLGNDLNITGGNVFGTVNVSGNGILNSNRFLTLKSNALGTARVAFGAIVDTITVERNITSKRAWRILTVPVTTKQTLFSAWQEGYTNKNPLTCPPENIGLPGFGTNLTYRYSDISNGYDLGPQQNPSIKGFANNTFFVPASTTTTLMTASDAWFTFVRGDRSICMLYAVSAGSNGTVLRTRGILNFGTITKNPSASAGQYIMVGNPYASSIDLTGVLLRSIGIDPTKFWIWDPGVGLNGGYISYLNGTISPTSTNYPTNASAIIIQSGQGFFLQATSENPQVIFMESDKTASESSVFSRVALPEIQINLLSDTSFVLDGAAAQFNTDTSIKSAIKFSSIFEQLSFSRDNIIFSIESRLLPNKNKDTFFLEMSKMKNQKYILRISLNDLFTKGTQARLIDTFLGSDSLVLHDINEYPFMVMASDTNTYKHRFMIICDKKLDLTTPVMKESLGVYPNPVKNILTITGHLLEENATIIDITGKIVCNTKIISNTVVCSFLQSGMYFLKIGTKIVKFNKL